jgi:DNA-binding transcriptional MerR regulator
MTKERTYTISELSREFDVTPRALRFYEDKGLLAPHRDGLNRVYSYRDRGRLKIILHGKRVGLSLNDIKDILDLYKIDQRSQALTALKKYKDRVVALEAQRLDIDAAIKIVEEHVVRLQEMLADPAFGVASGPDARGAAQAYDAEARRRLEDAH